MIERKCVTGENCISCGHSRIFILEERTEYRPDGREHFEDLICAACGASQMQGNLDVQVPDVAPELGPLFGGGAQDPPDRAVRGQLALDLGPEDGGKIY
jgi:hypothetical protein